MPQSDFPDMVAYLKDGWAVRFNGCIEGARWHEMGSALAHLYLLQTGKRKPQPEIRSQGDDHAID
jgi:hypothetical protein